MTENYGGLRRSYVVVVDLHTTFFCVCARTMVRESEIEL